MSQRIKIDEDEPAVDVAEAEFGIRHGDIRKDKWFTDEFKIIDFLGRGKFGEVKRCVETSTGREFAAKFICTPRPQERKDVEHEVSMMRKLSHRRLVQLYDAFEAKKEMCLVLEIIYGGELFDRVVSDDFLLTEKACVCLMRQICEGVEFMHSTNIIHLDLKPENILCLTKSGNRIKIIDFGLAREFNPKVDTRVMFGTPEFMAPEVVQYDPIDFSTDIWSIGVICYVLLSGLSPFMGDTDVETLSNVSKGKYDFAYSEFDKVSSDAKDFISKLLVIDKKKRITARQCLDHVWLSKFAVNSSPDMMNKTQLKHFLSRRKWQKAINVIIALRRMGWNMRTLQKSSGVNCRQTNSNGITSSKGWGNSSNKSAKLEITFKGAFKNSVEPQVRTKGVTKVKSAESDSAIVKTKNQIIANQSSKTDPVLPTITTSTTTTAATNTTASTNRSDPPITNNTISTNRSDPPITNNTASINRSDPPITNNTAYTNRSDPPITNTTVSTNRSDSPITNTTFSTNRSDPPITNTVSTNRSDPTITNTTISTNRSDPQITNNTASTNKSDKPVPNSDQKKCRKSVEHISPGNGHVFNLAKVVAHKPRCVINEFRPSWEDGGYSTSSERDNNYLGVGKDMNNCADVVKVDGAAVDGRHPDVASYEIGAIKQPKQQNNNGGERPRRKDLMIREKIRFFNQIEEKPIHTGKTRFLFKDSQS